MKFLFIIKSLIMEHLGIMSLSAGLKEDGHQVDICCLSEGENPESFMPVDFVCYSVCSGSEDFYLSLNKKLKSNFIFKSIFGGPAVTFSPEIFQEVDFVVRGEGEKAIVSIANNKPYSNLKLMNLDELPMLDRDIVYKYKNLRENPIKNIISRRGCKYACSYCFNKGWNQLHKGQIPKGVVRYRSVDKVIEEVAYLKKECQPLDLVNFVDDNFASSLDWLNEFVSKWESIKLPFFCSIRPEDATEEVFLLLSKAGCQIANMAIESANDINRKCILNRTSPKEAVIKALRLADVYGIKTRLQNIIGLPAIDPLADAFETLDFNILANPTSSWCAILQAYKGTKVYEIAKDGGYTVDDNLVDEGFFGESKLNLRDKKLIFRLHKLWPIITKFPKLRFIVNLLIRIPIPNFLWNKIFLVSKKHFAERDLWFLKRK